MTDSQGMIAAETAKLEKTMAAAAAKAPVKLIVPVTVRPTMTKQSSGGDLLRGAFVSREQFERPHRLFIERFRHQFGWTKHAVRSPVR